MAQLCAMSSIHANCDVSYSLRQVSSHQTSPLRWACRQFEWISPGEGDIEIADSAQGYDETRKINTMFSLAGVAT